MSDNKSLSPVPNFRKSDWYIFGTSTDTYQFLTLRRNIYYYRRIVNGREIKRSLHTSNLRTAQKRVLMLDNEIERELLMSKAEDNFLKKLGLSNVGTEKTSFHEIQFVSRIFRDNATGQVYRSEHSGDDDAYVETETVMQKETLYKKMAATDDPVRKAIYQELIDEINEQIKNKKHVPAPFNDLDTNNRVSPVVGRPDKVKEHIPFDTKLAEFIAVEKRSRNIKAEPKTEKEKRSYASVDQIKKHVNDFGDFIDNKSIYDIDPGDFERYHDVLLDEEYAPATIKTKIYHVLKYWKYLEKWHKDLYRADVLKPTLQKSDDVEARSFSDEETAQFLDNIKGLEEPHLKQIALIAFYSGARLNEIAQLTADDIKIKDGIHYIDINDNNGKSVKNDNAKRTIPVHNVLIDLGFLDFVKTKKRNLFRRDSNLSKKYGIFIKGNIKIADGLTKLVFHSIRKTVATKLQNTDTVGDSEFRNMIIGHEQPNELRRYYDKSTLPNQQVLGIINRIDYNYDISKLKDIFK